MAAASSPYVSAAIRVNAAVTTQVTMSRPGDCVWRAMSAETIKIPDPIMDPMTSVVASSRPRPLTRPFVFGLPMRAYCTLPFPHPLPDGCGGASDRQKIADDSYRIGAAFEHGSRVIARDAADRYERLVCESPPGTQTLDAHDRVGIDLGLGGEHR